jgi:hypothetical protein
MRRGLSGKDFPKAHRTRNGKIARGKRRTIGSLNLVASATKCPSSATTWRLWYHDARVSLAPRGRTRRR